LALITLALKFIYIFISWRFFISSYFILYNDLKGWSTIVRCYCSDKGTMCWQLWLWPGRVLCKQ